MLGADARKSAKARNPRPAREVAVAGEVSETLRARDGAEINQCIPNILLAHSTIRFLLALALNV